MCSKMINISDIVEKKSGHKELSSNPGQCPECGQHADTLLVVAYDKDGRTHICATCWNDARWQALENPQGRARLVDE